MHISRPPMLVNDLVGVDVGPTNLSLASLIETARVSGLAGRVRSSFGKWPDACSIFSFLHCRGHAVSRRVGKLAGVAMVSLTERAPAETSAFPVMGQN